jgi:AcrR family transcriptional regulator
VGLRERKKEETRRELMRQALRLFAEQGYEATTVEEIATAADVSPRTFFRYYPRKADVLFGDVDDRRAAIAGALAADSDVPLLQRIRGAVLAMAGAFGEEPELYANRARLVFSDDALHAEAYLRMTRVEALLRAAFARELGTDPEGDVRPRIAAAAVTAAVRSTAMTWAGRDGRGDPRELVQESFAVIEAGLSDLLDGAGG